MPHLSINIHLFCSKEKKTSANDLTGIEQTIWDCIQNKAKKKGIILNFFYGTSNQLFCIITLKTNQTIPKVIDSLNKKGGFFLNNKGVSDKLKSPQLSAIFNSEEKYEFDWNKDIYMLEVSNSVYDRISNYNQIKLESNGKKIFGVTDEYVVQYSIGKI